MEITIFTGNFLSACRMKTINQIPKGQLDTGSVATPFLGRPTCAAQLLHIRAIKGKGVFPVGAVKCHDGFVLANKR